MPPVNHAVIASVGIVAASVAVAAAIAIYEIPEVRRAAEDLRRRIAIALHSLGDNVDPNRPPRFNRPEDAEGFYESHDVDADEETRRRQREELMYWNMRRKEEKQRESQHSRQSSRGSTFDDFLKPDQAGESGTYVYNSGAAAWDPESSNVLRRRGGNADGARAVSASLYANPFGDEHGIELEDHAELAPPTPRDEVMSDIYNATPLVRSPVFVSPPPYAELPVPVPVPAGAAAASEVLFDFAAHAPPSAAASEEKDHRNQQHPTTTQPQQHKEETDTATFASRSTTATLDRELADDEYMTAGQDDRTTADAYASIQAWAQHSLSHHDHDDDDHNDNSGFYSPLPSTPRAPVSEPEVISTGQLTPAESASVAGWSVADADAESRHEDGAEVLSESEGEEGGVHTPGSWSEVGSVVSESESAVRAQ